MIHDLHTEPRNHTDDSGHHSDDFELQRIRDPYISQCYYAVYKVVLQAANKPSSIQNYHNIIP